MARQALTVGIRVDGAKETLAAFKALPKDASAELRVAALKLADLLADRVRRAGQAEGRQAVLLAGTVKAKRDRVPVIEVGGVRRIGRAWPKRGRGKAFELLFGSEFGGRGHGFKPHLGKHGYWVFPTIEASQTQIAQEWNAAADAVIRKFTAGGPR